MGKSGALIVSNNKKCMNTCLFCAGTGDKSKTTEEIFQQAIKDANYFIENEYSMIEISGGDPGEFEGIAEIIYYLKQGGIGNITLSTHGRKMKDEELVKRLAVAGLDRCRIPLYGSTSEIHNKTTQVENSTGDAFADSTQGIKNLVKHGIKIDGHTVVNMYNKDDIENIINLYMDLTDCFLGNIVIGPSFISTLSYSYTKDWFIPMKDLGPYLSGVIKESKKIPDNIWFQIRDFPYCVFGQWDESIINYEPPPDLGQQLVKEGTRSKENPHVPHYRVKTHFHRCAECSLKNECDGIPVNELKMFGTYGLEPIK